MKVRELQSAVGCIWPRGCGATTKDPSRLCHHHRRFSAELKDASGNRIKAKRVAESMKLKVTNPEQYEQSVQASGRCVASRPKVIMTPDNQIVVTPVYDEIITWNGQSRQAPFQDEQGNNIQIAHYQDSSVLTVTPSSPKGMYSAIQSAELVAESQYGEHHVRQHHMEEMGMLEEYDDEAEVIGQLNLGGPCKGTLTVTDISALDDSSPERFIFRPGDDSPAIAGELSREYPCVTEDGTIVPKWNISNWSTSSSQPITEPQKDMLAKMVQTRWMVDMYGFRSADRDRLYLPMGWNRMLVPTNPKKITV